MPSNVVKGFAEKTGKSEAEVEKKWNEAKAAAKKEYPKVSENDDRFYAIVTGILKKMLGIKESFDEIIDSEFEKLNEMEGESNDKDKKKMKKSDEDEAVDDEDEEDEEDKKKMKNTDKED